MLPLSICEKKKSGGNSNYVFLQLKTFTVLAWFTTFKLAVKSYIDEYKRELRQHLELWRKFAPFPPAKTPKTILDFKVVFFQHFPCVCICSLLTHFPELSIDKNRYRYVIETGIRKILTVVIRYCRKIKMKPFVISKSLYLGWPNRYKFYSAA